MAEKHLHTIIFNSEPGKKAERFTYDFSSTKNVEIALSKDKISIKARLTKIYDHDEMLKSGVYLFPDAIKKAVLLHIILFSENIEIKKAAVQIDSDEAVVYDGCPVRIYSMVTEKLKRRLPKEFSESETIRGILSKTKSSYDSRMASLFALICSKSKVFESERFVYLWMAFNGMYNYFASVIKDEKESEEEMKKLNRLKHEATQIRCMQELFGMGKDTILKEDKSRIANKVSGLLKYQVQNPINKSSLAEEENLAKNISAYLVRNDGRSKYNLTAYGYMLTQFPYYFRCKIIHADEPLKLFCYEDDTGLKCLRIINDLLEEFTDENLPLWFKSSYIDEHIRKAARTIKIE